MRSTDEHRRGSAVAGWIRPGNASRTARGLLLGAAVGLAATGSAAAAASFCSVTGRVLDLSGQPVRDVAVVVEKSGALATTGADGRFCLQDLPPGPHEVAVVGASGRRQVRPVVVEAGRPVTADVVLDERVKSDVVVTATLTERRLEDVPVRTEVIGRSSIEQVAATTLADAVEFTPGVRVESSCQNCNFQQVRLLGLDGTYSQILIDGLPGLSSLAQVYGIEQLPADMIERVEVVKGGGSALYGPGAVAGVINVLTRDPLRTSGDLNLRASWMAGAPDQSGAAMASWVSESGGTTVLAFGSKSGTPPIDLTGDEITEVSRRDLRAAGARLTRSLLGETARFRLDATYTTEERRGGNRLDLPPDQTDITEAVDAEMRGVSLGWFQTVGSSLDLRLSASYTETKRDSYYGAGGDPNAYGESENPFLVLQGVGHLSLGKHLLTGGVQWSADELTDSQPAYDRFVEDRYTDLGLFLQDDWSVASGVQLVAGARVDRHSEVSRTIVSPRVAMLWSPSAPVTLRSSVSTGFRAPQVFNEDLHITAVGGQGQVIRNAPGLVEERAVNAILGAEWRPRLSPGLPAQLEVNLFHTRIEDIFGLVEADDPATTNEQELERRNLGKARVQGVELNAGLQAGSRLTLQAGLVLQRARYDEPEPEFGSRDFFRTPERYGTLVATWRTPSVADLFVGLRYDGPMKVPHYAGYVEEDRLETTSSFLTFDVGLTRRFPLGRGALPAITAAFTVKNVTDAYQKDLDQGADRDSGYVYGPRFPRTMQLSVGLQF